MGVVGGAVARDTAISYEEPRGTMRKLAALLLACLGLAACGQPGLEVRSTVLSGSGPRPQSELGFWERVCDVQPHATAADRPAGAARLEAGLVALASGHFDEAALELDRLASQSPPDSLARSATRLLATLHNLRSDWPSLDALMRQHPWLPAEHWLHDARRIFAAGLRDAPPSRMEFGRNVVRVPTTRSRLGAPELPVTLGNDRLPATFWFDSASFLSVLGSDLAEQLGVERCGDEAAELVLNDGRTLLAHPAVLPRLQVGELVFHDLPVGIIDSRKLEYKVAGFTLFKLDGILGGPLLHALRITVDYAGGHTTLEPTRGPARGPGDLVWAGQPLARGHDEQGRPLWFLVMTAASRTLLQPSMVGRYALEPNEAGYVRDFPLELGGHALELSTVKVEDAKPLVELVGVDGRLGSDLLGRGMVVMDLQAGEFRFVPALP